MSVGGAAAVIHADAQHLVRPYAVTGGRTRPTTNLHVVSHVVAIDRPYADLGPDHDEILRICRFPQSVAEVSARSGLPLPVTKILLADLQGCGAIIARDPAYTDRTDSRPSPELLEKVLDGLRRL